jgi:hypothetical protein
MTTKNKKTASEMPHEERVAEYHKRLGLKNRAPVPDQLKKAWWSLPPEKGPNRVLATTFWQQVEFLEQDQSWKSRMESDAYHVYFGEGPKSSASLYGNQGVPANDEVDGTAVDDGIASRTEPSYNIIESMGLTLKSKIAADKTKVKVQVEGGTSVQKRRGQDLEQFLLGCMIETKTFREMPEVFIDALIFGTGYLQVSHTFSLDKLKPPQITVERLPPMRVLVDEREATVQGGVPQQWYVKKGVSKAKLMAMYPDVKSELAVVSQMMDGVFRQSPWTDNLLLVEGFRLPSFPGAGDGRHVLAVENVVLVDEPWTRETPNIAVFKWEKLPQGFYGRSLVQQAMKLQEACRRQLTSIDLAMQTCGNPLWMVQDDANVSMEQMEGLDIASILRYTGPAAPQLTTGNPINPMMITYLQELFQKIFDLAGISQLSAAGAIPVGMTNASGEALRTMHSIESERFKMAVVDYQEAHIDVAKLLIAEAREISADFPKFGVRTPDDRFLKKIPWRKVDLDDEIYTLQLFPTNFLPSTPEGKMAAMQDLNQLGLVSREDMLDNFDFPDVKGMLGRENAVVNFIDMCISSIVDEGKFMPPVALGLDFDLAIKRASQAYLEGIVQKLSSDRLAMLAKFVEKCVEMKQMANPPPLPPPPPMAQPSKLPPAGTPALAVPPSGLKQ